MKSKLVVLLLLVSCATAGPGNQYAYEEMSTCPSSMSEELHQSGVVRCRAMCSSYGRDFAEYDASDCKCRCAPGSVGAGAGGYRPKKPAPSPWNEGQTMLTPQQR